MDPEKKRKIFAAKSAARAKKATMLPSRKTQQGGPPSGPRTFHMCGIMYEKEGGEFVELTNGHILRFSAKNFCYSSGNLIMEFVDVTSESFQALQPPPNLKVFSYYGSTLPFNIHCPYDTGYYLVQLCAYLELHFEGEEPMRVETPDWPFIGANAKACLGPRIRMPPSRKTRQGGNSGPPPGPRTFHMCGIMYEKEGGEFVELDNGHILRFSAKNFCYSSGNLIMEFVDVASESFQALQPPPNLKVFSYYGSTLPFNMHCPYDTGGYLVQLCAYLELHFEGEEPMRVKTLDWPFIG
ncbi:hypothetical protein C8J56DRAFT_1161592, partial [Mycena floridula]